MRTLVIALACASCIPSFQAHECVRDSDCVSGFCDEAYRCALSTIEDGGPPIGEPDAAEPMDAQSLDGAPIDALPIDSGIGLSRTSTTDATPLEPTLIALPGQGGSFEDPTFKTRIVRVTDARAQSGSIHWGSDRSPFNSDSTLFVARTNGEFHLWIFDPIYQLITDVGLLEPPECELSLGVWSHSDPQVLYCVGDGLKLLSFHVGNRTATLIHDFEPDFPGTVLQPPLSVDDSDSVFAFIASGASSDDVVVYDLGTGITSSLSYPGTLRGASISRSGTHAVIRYPSGLGFWELAGGTEIVPADDTARGYSCAPSAYTDDLHLAWDCNAGVIVRELASPPIWRDVFRPPNLAGFPNYDNQLSVSLNQGDQSFVIIGVSNQTELNPGWDPYQSEIVAAATDGSWLVRLAHHHSVTTTPFPAISYDGRFVMFTSNWDSRHQDLFILVMPGVCP